MPGQAQVYQVLHLKAPPFLINNLLGDLPTFYQQVIGGLGPSSGVRMGAGVKI
jgi:hypothetical protein